MRRSNWLIALALLHSSACVVDNPRNCSLTTSTCAQGERCNMETQRCESLDCTVNQSLCSADEYCAGTTKRCAPRDCVMDPAFCTATQDCNTATRKCQVRTFVLGQPDAMTNLNAAYGMNNPEAVLLLPDPTTPGRTKLIVGDVGNARILIWNDLPTANRPADAVLGAPDVHTLNNAAPYGGVSERSVSSPFSVTTDGTRLIVGDQLLHRVLTWNLIPTQPSGGEPIPANQLWGQTDFEASSPNGGSDTTNQLGANGPMAFLERLVAGGTGVYTISDRLNHRVLVFKDGVPAGPQTGPTYVLGQADFAGNAPGTVSPAMKDPRIAATDGTLLYVPEVGNNRILAYKLSTMVNNTAADASPVFGQATTMSGTPNFFGFSVQTFGASCLNQPTGVSIAPTAGPKKMWVADFGNNRVLRYSLPSSVADVVLGQADFLSTFRNRNTTPTAASMSAPYGVSSDGVNLAVSDYLNNRVLLWTNGQTSGEAADVVLGQPDGASTLANNPPNRTEFQYANPTNVATDGTHLGVVDTLNHRILLWNKIPQSGSTPPDVILGQPNGTGSLANQGMTNPTAETLNAPASVAFENGKMVVADSQNNRVLIWNQIPAQSPAPADHVFGQIDFANGGFRSAGLGGLGQPQSAVLDQGVLYVADFGNHRVVIYPTPLANQTVSVVLGQNNIGNGAPNFLGQSAKSLVNPRAVLVDNGKLFVVDRGNHRVLIWNTIPTATFTAANVVVGQTDFISSYTSTDRTRLTLPRNVFVYKGRLYVSGGPQNRILYWNAVPTSNGQRADGVLGQSDFLSTFPNNSDMPPVERLSFPSGMAAVQDQLFIADSLNHRVVVRGIP